MQVTLLDQGHEQVHDIDFSETKYKFLRAFLSQALQGLECKTESMVAI